MSKEKDSRNKPATTTAPPDNRPRWKRVLGIGKPQGTDAAKSSGTSPPAAATPTNAAVPMGTPPEIDLTGFQFEGDPSPVAVAEKPKSDGPTIAKQCRAARAICQKHHAALLGIIHDPNGNPGEMADHIGFLIDTVGNGLSAGQKGVLWDFAIGAFFGMVTEKHQPKAGASADDATKVKEELKKAVAAFFEGIDPFNHPEADLKGVFRVYGAMLGALLGHEARAGRLKIQVPVKSPKGKPKDPDDSDGPLAMPVKDGDGPAPGPKGPRGSGTPIHGAATHPNPAGMGKGSLLAEAGVDPDTIPLAVEGDDDTKGKGDASAGSAKKK